MPKKPLKPLKQARQARSRLTWRAILDAGARILVENPAQFTTNRVAARAGVSIGSLYQYFPNKESILGEIVERELAEDLAYIRDMVEGNSGKPLPEVFQAFLSGASHIAGREAQLKQVLNQQLSTAGKTARAAQTQLQIVDLLSELFASAHGWPAGKDPRLAAYLAVTSLAHTFWLASEFGEYSHGTLQDALMELFLKYVS